uniref:NAD-dependent protein deacetylase n=1 Tax=Phallusia mammillata TaxID=59560 RepID=A0A6F9DSH9_9ASCI|nr:NAD-dependent protein deacetylase sirtuin-2 [Phallusia mammillata]
MSEENATNSASASEEPAAAGNAETSENQSPMDLLQSLLKKFSLTSETEEDVEPPEKLLDELSVTGVANYILSEKCKNIVVMCGAGISTAAGIPDFRSPGTGLYDNLQKYDLKNPTDIFEITYFKKNPQPFFTLAKELYPGNYKATVGHFFLKLLEDKGKLQRVYTQNIDGLERVAGVDGEKIVEAHGTFYTNQCVDCKRSYSKEWMKEKIFKDEIPYCEDCKEGTSGLVKPDIVFFGEALPQRFFNLRYDDFQACDLLIVMGTSLKVQPFASLVGGVDAKTPRLLINRELCGETDPMMLMMGFNSGMDFESEKAYRDVALLGDCDDGCKDLCEKLGWLEDLLKLVADGDKQNENTTDDVTKKTDTEDKMDSKLSLETPTEKVSEKKNDPEQSNSPNL